MKCLEDSRTGFLHLRLVNMLAGSSFVEGCPDHCSSIPCVCLLAIVTQFGNDKKSLDIARYPLGAN